MRFEDAVTGIGTLTDLRRVASAHVVDHNQLADDQIRAAVIAAKPQYSDIGVVSARLDKALFGDPKKDARVLTRALLIDVLLHQYDFALPFAATEEAVIAFEQQVVDASNEKDLAEMAAGDKNSQRFRDIEIYNFVLEVAWDNQSNVSTDEANLLRNLRRRLRINEWDHRVLEAKLGKYPKPWNEVHSRTDINQARRSLQSHGLLFPFRQEDGTDVDVIPQEIAQVIREYEGVEIRTEAYLELFAFWKFRRKSHLRDILEQAGVPFSQYDVVDKMVERVVYNIPPSRAIASASPRFGLTSEELTAWCRQFGVSTAGPVEERVAKVITHFDQIPPRVSVDGDEREMWYRCFESLAIRDYDSLRAQHVIDKDLEIESMFEEATRYLFHEKLNHSPLKQAGSAHADGLLSLRDNYLMWDNKSKEPPGEVHLKDHITQFNGYMESTDKVVPVFLVIGPGFTPDSEVEAIRYHSKHFNRNIVLISAKELKDLAEEWSAPKNPKRDEPFPLELLSTSGRYDRKKLGKLA